MPFDSLQNLLMPRRCVFCATRCIGNEGFVCDGCLNDLPWQQNLFAEPLPELTVVAAPLEYAFPVDAALKSLKFRRRLEYVPWFARLLCDLSRHLPADIDALQPMPLHWRRHAQRGFNQAWELSKALHTDAGLPLLTDVRRHRATAFQSGLEASARRANLRDAFTVGQPLVARHVLIVDDVITTGESCRQLAKTLLAAGARRVSALAVARTH